MDTEGDIKGICALQTQTTGQELHVAAPNVILHSKDWGTEGIH